MTQKLMMAATTLAIALFFCTSQLATAQDSSTPKGLLTYMQQALNAQQQDAFLACFDATEEKKLALTAMYELLYSLESFTTQMKSTYKDVKLPIPEGGQFGNFRNPQWVAEFTFTPKDATTVVAIGKGTQPITFVKLGEVWRIDPDNMLLAPGNKINPKVATLTYNSIKKALDMLIPHIGKEGVTADKINSQLVSAMKAIAVQAAQAAGIKTPQAPPKESTQPQAPAQPQQAAP